MAADESLRHFQARLKAQQNDQRPLIDKVNNQWMDEKSCYKSSTNRPEDEDDLREIGCCDLDEQDSCPNAVLRFGASKRFRKMLSFATIILLAALYVWRTHVRPRQQEDFLYEQGFVAQKHGTYGIAKGGDLDKDLVRVQRLDRTLQPGGKDDPLGKRRLVFVGDVHGCKKELTKLLNKVNFDEKHDHLILTGDIISKGPDNVGVLDELIRLGATSVRGNHEDRILHIAKSLDQDELVDAATSSKGRAKDVELLKHLKKQHIEYLRNMPLMLHIPALRQASKPTNKRHSPINEPILVVHAGLVPGIDLSKQDPYFVMNMRSIDRRTHVPSTLRDGKNAKPWFDIWNWYNDRISSRGASFLASYIPSSILETLTRSHKSRKPRPLQVIYGHDSKAGLQINRWSKGLDSGCVNGDELTAMVVDAKGRFELHSVGCKNYRD